MWKKYKVISWILMMVFLISAFGKADYQAVAQESNVKKSILLLRKRNLYIRMYMKKSRMIFAKKHHY